MFTRSFQALALASTVLLGATISQAQDSGPLIDLLVKKGLINDQEAETLRAELVKEFTANTSAGKLDLAATDSVFRISGDVRVRYENRSGSLPSGDNLERNRFRYRLRTGITARILNDWTAGLRLETGSGSRSSNVTLGDDGGPYAKTNDGIYVGQIWTQWTPRAGVTFTAGRMPNPFVTTSMIWDGDINPEGFAEQYKHRDGDLEYSITAGQFLYSAASTQNAFGSTRSLEDILFFGWQGGVKYYLNGTSTFLQANPTIYHYYDPRGFTGQAGGANEAFGNTFTASNAAGINNIFIVDIPFEYNWLLGGKAVRAFGDIAYNIDGDDRARKYSTATIDSDEFAWQVGFQYGRAVNRGEWDARVFYQSVGAFALDPNLVDSDLFDSRTNMRGFVINGNYALGAATQLTLTFAQGKRKDDSIIAPGVGDIGSNNALDTYYLLQADLNLKF